jgi:hypothetical protein
MPPQVHMSDGFLGSSSELVAPGPSLNGGVSESIQEKNTLDYHPRPVQNSFGDLDEYDMADADQFI